MTKLLIMGDTEYGHRTLMVNTLGFLKCKTDEASASLLWATNQAT